MDAIIEGKNFFRFVNAQKNFFYSHILCFILRDEKPNVALKYLKKAL